MSQKTHAVITCAMGIDTGKNTLHLVGLDDRGTIVLREKLGRSRIRTRLANVPPCLIGIEAGMTTHYVARELIALGHDVRQVPLTLTACRRSCDRALRRFALRFEVYPRGHGSRVGLGLLGNDDAFPLRDLLGVQHLCRAYRFEVELPQRFTLGFLGRVFAEKFSADRYRRLVARRRLDALLPGETVGKALHRRRRRKRPVAVADRRAKQGRPAGGAAFLELADDALGDIAHCVNRTDHLLLADNDIVEQAFKLRRHPRIDQGRVGLFENTEQRQAGLGRHDVLSLGNQETLFLQPADDLRSGRRRANALGLLQALPQNLIVNKAPGILHRLDQSAFVVTRRWSGLLVLDFRIVQLRSLAVAQRRQQLRLVALFVGGLPVRESLATGQIPVSADNRSRVPC